MCGAVAAGGHEAPDAGVGEEGGAGGGVVPSAGEGWGQGAEDAAPS